MQKLKTIQKYDEVAEFELADLLGIGMTFVVLGIGLTYGLVVQSDVRGDINQYSCPANYELDTGWNTTYCVPTNDTSYNVNHTVANLGTSEQYTGITDSINATGKLANKQGLLVTIVIAAVVIGILVRYLWVKFS